VRVLVLSLLLELVDLKRGSSGFGRGDDYRGLDSFGLRFGSTTTRMRSEEIVVSFTRDNTKHTEWWNEKIQKD
jgi:hypothetical protein